MPTNSERHEHADAPERQPQRAEARGGDSQVDVTQAGFSLPSLTTDPIGGIRTADLLALQHVVGNRAVQRIIQRKLRAGAAHDVYEQEADRIADAVVRSPAIMPTPVLQRHPGHGVEEDLQTHRDDSRGAFDVGRSFEDRLAATSGGGSPLPEAIRDEMEGKFGTDFSDVRLHTGSVAMQLNRDIDAHAFTHGSDVYMGDTFQPTATADRHLLAHELTHVVQQRDPAVACGSIQRKTVQHSVASIIAAGVTVANATGDLGQVGHRMDVWVDIDAGAQPKTPLGAKPNTVYGLELEYWEFSTVPHDNQGPIGLKPWNDIYAFKPDATTFAKPAAGCDLTWTQAVEQAQAGTLKGRKRIGFSDYPGLFLKPNRTVKRDLQFRVVFRDGSRTEEIYATQMLDMVNGQLGYSAYQDNMGNKVEAHGFGTDAAVHDAANPLITNDASRLIPNSLPTYDMVVGTIPAAVRGEIASFMATVARNQGEEFVDIEKDVFLHRLQDDERAGASHDWDTQFLKELTSDKPGIVAGEFMIPSLPGTTRKQQRVPGGLLVALVKGKQIVRMYFTDNTYKSVNLSTEPESKLNRLKVRSFTEVPYELMKPTRQEQQLNTQPEYKTARTNSRSDIYLRSFRVQGDAYIVDINSQIGPKVSKGDTLLVQAPEVRDVGGQWIKAKVGDTIGFVRADKLKGGRNTAKGTLYHIYWTTNLRDAAQIKQGRKTVPKQQRKQIEQQAKQDRAAGLSEFKALQQHHAADKNLQFDKTFLRVDTTYTAKELQDQGLHPLLARGGGMTLVAGPQLLTEFDVQSGDSEETAKKAERNQTLFEALDSDPAVRTAFASPDTTIPYVKAHHAHFENLQRLYDGIYGIGRLKAVLVSHFEERVRALGETPTRGVQATLYETMMTELPIPQASRMFIPQAFGNVFPNDLEAIKTQRWHQTRIGQQLVGLGAHNVAGILNAIAAQPDRVHEFEKVYNEIFKPASFGTAVFDHFVAAFRGNDNGQAYFQQQTVRYPSLSYLLRPAYRLAFGDAQLQTVLGQMRAADLVAAVPDPGSLANLQAETAFLTGGPYSLTDFAPSTAGKFDARYDPQLGELDITLKVAFIFKDNASATAKDDVVGEFAKNKWDAAGKLQYISDFKTQVEAIWSGKHTIRLEHPGWNNVPPVTTNLIVEETRLGKEHFRIEAYKGTVVNAGDADKIKSENQRSSVDTDIYKATLQEHDVKDKLRDPVVHQYLHQAEKIQNIDKAYDDDRKRVNAMLTGMGRIVYQRSSATNLVEANLYQVLREELQRLDAFSVYARRQKILVLGARANGESKALAGRRATHAQTALAAAGYPIQTGISPDDFAGVIISVPEDAEIKEEYSRDWSRVSAAHEAGHMLGLVDEYIPVASVEMTRKMISDGLLPPGTPASHITGDGTGYEDSSDSTEQSHLAGLYEQTNLSAPDFTQSDGARSTSLMTGGFDVMTSHYVTIWEALATMCERQAGLDRKFWMLG